MAASPNAQSRSILLRAFAALVLVLVGVFLTGCTIELALDTTVENDGSGTIGIRMAADKEIQDLLVQQGGGADLFAEFENQMPEGWQVDSGTDPDGTRWVTATTSFADLDEFQAMLQEGGQGPASAFSGQQISLTQESSLFTTKTVFQAEWDAGSALSSAGSELPEGVDMSMLSSIFQIQNRLTLPGSIGENNADEVDGNTLVWTPGMTGVTSMSAESTAYNWAIIIGIIVAVVVVLLVVIVVLILLLRRKAPAAPPAVAEGAPGEPGQAGLGEQAQPVAQPVPPGEQPPAPAPGQPGETLWAQPPVEPSTPVPPAAPPAAAPLVAAGAVAEAVPTTPVPPPVEAPLAPAVEPPAEPVADVPAEPPAPLPDESPSEAGAAESSDAGADADTDGGDSETTGD